MFASKKLCAVVMAVLLGGSAFMVVAADAPATPDTPVARRGKGRLTKPWNELKDLSEDERTKILAIHQKALDQIHEIETQEHSDILATLTDDQKKEVAEIEAKDKAAKKPATQPAKS